MRLAVPYEPETETVAEHFGHAKWMKLYNEEGTVVFTDVVESPANGHDGVCKFLKEHGVRTRIRGKISEGSDEILQVIRAGYVSYILNTRAILSGIHYDDGVAIRQCAIANGVTMFTSLDTVRILLDVLEDRTPRISVI